MGNFLSAVTNIFTANTKAKSAEVNANFAQVLTLFNSFSYDAKHGTLFLQFGAKSADYTVTDTDGLLGILMTTGASNRTVTLPTAADNTGRILTVIKVDSGAGNVILDGEGAETINGSTTKTIYGQYAGIKIACNGTAWYVMDEDYGVLKSYQSYTPTFASFGTPTGVATKYRRNGSKVEVEGVFIPSAADASAASMTLPLSLTAVRTGNSGMYFRDVSIANNNGGVMISTASSNLMKFSACNIFSASSVNAMSPANANVVSTASENLYVNFAVEVSEWQ